MPSGEERLLSRGDRTADAQRGRKKEDGDSLNDLEGFREEGYGSKR